VVEVGVGLVEDAQAASKSAAATRASNLGYAKGLSLWCIVLVFL
jgi:hypothetical protein